MIKLPAISAINRQLSAVGAGMKAVLSGDPEPPDDPNNLIDGAFLRQVEALHFSAPRAATAGMAGEHASRRKAHSIEFADHRSYVPGDDFRLIDWNVYARLGELCLKLTEARENLSVHLLIDCSASMDWGRPNKLLYAKRVAAALGAVALAGYDTVYLGLFGGDPHPVLPPLRGRNAVGPLLERLRAIKPGGGTDLARSAAAYCEHVSRRGVAVLLTDFMAPAGHSEALHYLARAGLHTTALHVLDQQEETPALEGLLELHDCETDELVKVGVTPGLLRRYAAHFETWSGELDDLCRAQHAHYVRVSTGVPPRALVLQALRREGVLR
jgi:uncharacterized protein (DUF58 family)